MRMNKYRVAFATGSRADYGIVRQYLSYLSADKNIELNILVTGALLDNRFNHQVDLINEDGFNVFAKIELPLNFSNDFDIIHSMSVALDKFGKLFSDNHFDLLIILGDRYEMLSVAVAAAMQRMAILHIHGGELTLGNYDEFIRHSITKMSLFHFASTEEYRNRIIQLGESPERVFYLGALGAENCLSINAYKVEKEVKNLREKSFFTVLFHPETLTHDDINKQINSVMNAIKLFPQYLFVFIGSNADTSSNIIRQRVRCSVAENPNFIYFENLRSDGYHELLRKSICLIGNSSSGIIEAPSLGIYTINIGHRQDGRVKGNSVIDVDWDTEDIKKAIKKVLSSYSVIRPINPYYKKDSAKLYYETTVKLLKTIDKYSASPKSFYDLPSTKN